MSGYVEAGYIVVLGSLAAYSVRLLRRRRVLERKISPVPGPPAPPAPDPETTWP